MSDPNREELELFKKLLSKHRYDYAKLAYVIFPFGQKGHALEHVHPYDWQIEEWNKLSKHMMTDSTRFNEYLWACSSGNGAAKTAWVAMTVIMLMYTQRVRGRVTANTQPQINTVVWPEWDIWFNHARYSDIFFEKLGTSIKARDPKLSEVWRMDTVTWSQENPASISGLHNKGGCVIYVFEEAAGIPAVIFKYALGAFTETETMKVFFALANSDDPDSYFESVCMTSPYWKSRRIDTRTQSHISKERINALLVECGGNEDHDDFRVRVRGLPRKTARDSIVSKENIQAAVERAKDFDKSQIKMLPVVLTCDPAWQGGDETCIAYRQGPYVCLLEKYKLDRSSNETHMKTYELLCKYEKTLGADAVFIDQGEGTAVYTLAINAGKTNWELVSFAGSPNDTPEAKESEYQNIRAQMYYEFNKFLFGGGILDVREDLDDQTKAEWTESIIKQLPWTKGTRHKVTLKKLCKSKKEIKDEFGSSPDVADALVLTLARPIVDRLPENETYARGDSYQIGQGALMMPTHPSPYDDLEVDYRALYD
jgi:hypothetical protein